ncbi:tail spike protein [Salmonella phage FSL SP-058]|uniref:Tailspike protein n=1 Tax=Salmonella phage FSL SP-058 TaxID=1173761 RepID=S4TRC1_9CAUD|nr:tail spike protein [Salmonella phage FSL SP-058]AGF88193.1 tailspike protein [Salmonella phage FSL SP-058]
MIRTTNSCCGNEAGLVEKFIGTAYDVVKTVYENLGELQFIYDFLNKYGVLIAVSSVQELQALPTTAKYTRVYTFSATAGYGYTDYLYVDGDVTGVIPNDPTATGSWIVVASSTNAGSGSGDGGYIPWVYAQGSALGGETTIVVPDGTIGVPFIIVNGYMNTVGKGFTFDVGTLTITLAQPLEVGDEVVLLLSGTPAVPDNPNISDWIVFNWLYNGGAAVGGEQVINIPYTFQSVPAIFKNGLRYHPGLSTQSYTIDAANQRILLTEPLVTNDRLVVQVGGESVTVVMTDRTIQEVARAANVKDEQVILSTNTTSFLNGKTVIFDEVAQHIYGLPTLPNNVYISTVSNGQLTYNPGSVTVDLVPVPNPQIEAFKANTGAGLVGTLSGNSVQKELPTKMSAYTTLQEVATNAVNEIIIDEDYTFTDGESVDFGGKVLTINCKAKFIGDGILNWNNLGSGSTIVSPHMHTKTTPYTVFRFDSNGDWVTDPATVLASVTQRLDKGYKPNVNDHDIWSSLPDSIKNQVAGATLRVNSADNIRVSHPEATMGGYLFTLCNHILVESPRNFIAWESGITFENHHTTEWGTGNKVVGGEIKYGSGSAVVFIRNDGGDDHDGGVENLISYRVGESGVKTYQNEVGGRSARNYRLKFDNITTIQCYYDGIDVNADTGSPVERVDDYTLAEYPWFHLPTQHIIRNIITRDCMGIGAWWDGQMNIIDNVITYEAHKEGIFDRGTNNDITNVTVIGANKDLTNLNQLTCEGGSRLRGVMIHAYTTQGYAVYAPSSEISNVACAGSGTKLILCTYVGDIQGGNINVQHGDNTMTLAMRPAMGGTTNPSLLMTADCQVATPGGEASIVKLSAIQDGVRVGEMQLNRLGFKHMSIPVASTQLPESALEYNSSVGFFFGSDGVLRLLAKKPDGTFVTYTMS